MKLISEGGAGEEMKFPEDTFDLNTILPEDKSYYSYIGSLVCTPS